VDEFVDAVQEVFPNCCIHFEDWTGSDAIALLARYRPVAVDAASQRDDAARRVPEWEQLRDLASTLSLSLVEF
jgi:malic enzyme-like protein